MRPDTPRQELATKGCRRAWPRAFAIAMWLIVTGATAAPDPHFRTPQVSPSAALNARVLTDEERAFIAALPEVRVGVPTPPARPYEVVGSDGEVSGIHPDMLVALARTFGLRLKPVIVPSWSALLDAARRREVDIVMTLGVTAERMEYLAFTLGATPLPGALFARQGAKVEPATARFALERDFLANDWVRRQYPGATIVTVETTHDALRAVAEGRADVYLGSLLEAGDWLARQPVPGIEVNRMLPYGTGYYHFGVRKDWAPLAAILNKGIQTLRTTTHADLAAALGSLPGGARLPQPLEVAGAEAALLAAKPVWRVGAVRGLVLLNDIDERGVHSGIGAEYAEQVARRLGVAVQPVAFESVGSMLDALRRGDIDLVPFLTHTPQRAAEFDFSAPYVEMPYTLVARRDGPLFWNLDSLRGKRLALQPQHPLREVIERHYPDIRIVEAPPGTGAMELVLRREADAAVEVKLFANLRINSDDGEALRTVAEVAELPAQFHLATARSAQPLRPLVDRALAAIEPEERQRMLRRWVAVDFEPPFPWRRYAPVIAVTVTALLALGSLTAWWMQRLRREVLARRRSEQLLNDIATTVPGVAFRYVMDGRGGIRHNFFTPGAKDFLGIDLDPQRTVLAALGPYMDADEFRRAEAQQAECLHSGAPFKVTCRFVHPDGRPRWLHAEAVQTLSPTGNPVWTGYVVDVSTERELQQRLAEEAESRNLMLASASHELRAPTHTLSLALQSMPREGLADAQRKALDIAQDSAHTLAELLSDVLDAARAGHEALQLRPRTFDLHQLLDDLGRAWRAAARTKGLAFEVSIADEVPRTVTLDPLRLKQVLINLLSNACKYTSAGQVRLSAMRGDDGSLRLEVADTGIGMEADAQARVFDPYVTLDDPRAGGAQPASSGLGLTTSLRIARLMGGRIELHSATDEGTRAALLLPWPAAATDLVPRQGSVVLCDDDEVSRLLLAQMLRSHGFEVVETGDSHEALVWWRQGGVRALVTDLDLPGMSGLQLIRTLRDEAPAGTPRTPVIVCSGSPVPAADDAPERTLYDAYLVKPVDVSTLADALQRLGVLQA